jgi:hypothetical protein
LSINNECTSFNKGPSIGEYGIKKCCNKFSENDLNKRLSSDISGILLVNHKRYKYDAKIQGSFVDGIYYNINMPISLLFIISLYMR